jgi:hypothetical protein
MIRDEAIEAIRACRRELLFEKIKPVSHFA